MSSHKTVEIEIHCPVCNKIGKINVDEYPITQSKKGLCAINVSEDLVCQHSFVAYIDRNLSIRDCFVCDFRVNIPQITFEEDFIEQEELNFDIEIIKINFMPSLLINILKCIFFGKKVAIIYEDDVIAEHLSELLHSITQGSFKLESSIISRDQYKKNKKKYKDWIVLEKNDIFNDKENLIDPKQSQIENIIIQKFFMENDPISSVILTKNEVNKAYHLARNLVDFAENLSDNEELSSKFALKYFEEKYNTKIDLIYLKFLMNILEFYFGVKARKPSESADFLGLL